MRTMILSSIACALLAGCAENARPPRATPLSADLSAWVGASEPARATRRVASTTRTTLDDGRPSEPDRFSTKRLTPPADVTPRPRRAGVVNVTFQGADMTQAFQFLAEAGRFNVVLAEGLTAKVTATLRGVDPYDALVSLAEANGAKVVFDRGIVVVSKR